MDAGLWGWYDGNNGQWGFNEEFSDESYFGATITDDLIQGEYTLEILMNDNSICQATYQFNAIVDLPIVLSSSFDLKTDNSGNVLCYWEIPESLTKLSASTATQTRVLVNVFNQNQYAGYLSISSPSHMGHAPIPIDVIQKLLTKGDELQFGIQLRTRDNNNRAYSKFVNIGTGNIPGYFENLTGVKINANGTPKAGDDITITALTNHSADQTLYYRFDLTPGYGTPDFDPMNGYSTIQDWSTSNSCTHTFTSAGTYIITVYASPTPGFPEGTAPIYGGTITVE